MTLSIRRFFAIPTVVAACALGFTGCEKGTAEKVGERMDKAGQNVRDAVDPAGPAEGVGRTIDRNAPGN